jgi:hypothetical protein
MTIWTVPELASIWVNNGGNRNAVIYAVSVCKAESGGNDHAVSPSSDYGLWQINTINFASQGLNFSNVFDPNVNARVAIRMSGNGTNWAAWCTAWANPAANCGHGFLPVPEDASAAGAWIPNVAAQLRQSGIPVSVPTGPPNYPTFANYVPDALNGWSRAQHYLSTTAPIQWNQINNLSRAIRGMR